MRESSGLQDSAIAKKKVGYVMKRILGIVLLLAFFSLPLLAAKNSQEFSLPSNVRVGDAQLPEGRCVVTWTEASGSQVQLTIKTMDKKTVTVPARVVDEKRQNVRVLTFVADGVTYLKELQTKNTRFIIKDTATAD